MSKKFRKEQFIKKAKEKYGDKYFYDSTIYTTNRNKIVITCILHGDFSTLPTNFLKGWGCPKCGKEKQFLIEKERWFCLAENIHNNKYDYSLVEYKNSKENVTIICPVHGKFEQQPRNHLQGHGCYECARLMFGKAVKSNTSDFIQKSIKIHGDLYEYSLVNYINAETKVKIICKEHGIFEQIPRNHLSNSGCNFCNRYIGYSKSRWINYNINREGIFYIIKCYNEIEEFYKIGITARSVKERHARNPYKFEIIKEVKSFDLEYIWDLEKQEKRRLKEYKYTPKINFAGGSVECFSKIN